jgi:hypothetical protein
MKLFGGKEYINPILKCLKQSLGGGMKMDSKARMVEKQVMTQMESALEEKS